MENINNGCFSGGVYHYAQLPLIKLCGTLNDPVVCDWCKKNETRVKIFEKAICSECFSVKFEERNEQPQTLDVLLREVEKDLKIHRTSLKYVTENLADPDSPYLFSTKLYYRDNCIALELGKNKIDPELKLAKKGKDFRKELMYNLNRIMMAQ